MAGETDWAGTPARQSRAQRRTVPGLLVAALEPQLRRVVMANGLDVTARYLTEGGGSVTQST